MFEEPETVATVYGLTSANRLTVVLIWKSFHCNSTRQLLLLLTRLNCEKSAV